MTNPWDNKYPKSFLKWYSRHQNYDYRQSSYNAWKAGRKHQKKLAEEKVKELTAALQRIEGRRNCYHDINGCGAAQDAKAALKQEGRLERSLSRSTAFPASQAALEQEGE